MSIEDALTAAERKAVTKRVRVELLERVYDALDNEMDVSASEIVRAEVKAAKADKAFMASIRSEVRASIRAELKKIAKSVSVEVGF